MIIIFILIYLVSLVINIAICYQENKLHIFYVKDLLDEIEIYMWCPVANTFFLVALIVALIIHKMFILLKLDVLWEKFRNIKLK
jgi:hypothetical protein